MGTMNHPEDGDKPRRTRKKAGYGESAPTPAQVRKELAIERRAIRERWPGWEKLVPLAIKTSQKLMRSKHDRSNRAGIMAAVAIARQVQADEHLEAKIENSGVALIRYRETTTNPDGSTTTTEHQAMKLWGTEAPVEAV
jgi:hypothetical protein